MEWNLIPNEFNRIQTLSEAERTSGVILFKLDSQREKQMLQQINMRDDESAFDCLSIYRHADMSYEWRKCRIVRREVKDSLKVIENSQIDVEAFFYWIEFYHLRGQGSTMWCKREAK